MAKDYARDWLLTVGGVDLSDHVQSLADNRSRDEIDFTAMGATVRETGAGLADFSLDVTLFNDYASGSVWQTLETMFNAPDSTQTVVRKHVKSSANSATNPQYSMSAKLFGLTQGAAIGDAETMDVSFRNGSSAGIT